MLGVNSENGQIMGREFGRTGSRRANEGGGEDWALARNRKGSAANLILWGKRDGIRHGQEGKASWSMGRGRFGRMVG